MKGPVTLLENEDNWRTRMGLSFAGERVVFRGKDLFSDLKDLRWMELLLFGITGRSFDKYQIELFEGMWRICASYPDPRIWVNRAASLGGTVRTTGVLALSSAIALSEATIYGRRPDVRAIDFLRRSLELVERGNDLITVLKDELRVHRGIPGFARPLVNGDERIVPLVQLAEKTGCSEGKVFRHVFQIEETLKISRYRMKMNVAALAAALAADQGLSTKEYYYYLLPCFSGGIIPCFIDAVEHGEGALLPMRCSRITYSGVSKRQWK